MLYFLVFVFLCGEINLQDTMVFYINRGVFGAKEEKNKCEEKLLKLKNVEENVTFWFGMPGMIIYGFSYICVKIFILF